MTSRSTDPRAVAPGSTRTVDRAFDLLEAVTESVRARVGESPRGGGSSLSELARATGLSPATASRLLATLAKRGLVRRDEQGAYRPGLGLMQMAAVVLRGEPLYELAGGHLTELAAASGETANLGIAVDQDRALYLRQVAGDHRVQTASWAGRTIPREGTAMGAALAGSLGRSGYAVSRGLFEPDITAVAVPVCDYHGQIIAALSIIAPSYRTDDSDAARYGLLLVEHAAALSSALGAA
ncbi:MAG: IclR family transcriptional regulator, partial [Acidobacteriota bacterium]|nr:IclR family transcriptional regulator [Acidobacteriota bacterium]